MSTFVDLISSGRDREVYPNPCEYTIPAEKLNGWYASARTVNAIPQDSKTLEFTTSVELCRLTTPYSSALAIVPRLYVDFKTQKYNDTSLIAAISGQRADAKFIVHPIQIQGTSWIHWEPTINPQVMRIDRRSPISLRIFDTNGTTLSITDDAPPDPANPNLQTMITFKLTPYIRDSSFSNHTVETRVVGQ
jgi:hypothetical protein